MNSIGIERLVRLAVSLVLGSLTFGILVASLGEVRPTWARFLIACLAGAAWGLMWLAIRPLRVPKISSAVLFSVAVALFASLMVLRLEAASPLSRAALAGVAMMPLGGISGLILLRRE